MKTAFLPALCGLVATASFAHAADKITYRQDFGQIKADRHEVRLFSQYHGPVSDLVKVTLTFELACDDGSLGLDNDNAFPASGNAFFGTHMSLDSAAVPAVNPYFFEVFNFHAFSLAADDSDTPGVFDPVGPDSAQFLGGPVSDDYIVPINPADFAAFVGSGDFEITFDINSALRTLPSGVQTLVDPVTSSGSFSITYEFVPTPSAAALFGLGGMAALRRQRRPLASA